MRRALAPLLLATLAAALTVPRPSASAAVALTAGVTVVVVMGEEGGAEHADSDKAMTSTNQKAFERFVIAFALLLLKVTLQPGQFVLSSSAPGPKRH